MSITDYPNGSDNTNPLVLTDNSTQLQVTSGSATQSGDISESGGSFGLEKTGGGTLIFTADNTYSGTTTIYEGSVMVGGDVSGGGPTGSITGNVVLGVTGIESFNTALIFNRSNDLTYSNVMSGAGSVVQSGSGRITLTRVNTYAGTTTVGAGSTLALTGTGSIAASAYIAVYGLFDISATSAGASVVALSSFQGYGKPLFAGGAVSLGSNTLTLTSLAGGDFAGVIQDGGIAGGTGGGIIIAGGHHVFAGNNTYTGTTTIAQDVILSIGSEIFFDGITGSLGTGAVVNNGTLQYGRTDTTFVDNDISGSGRLLQLGSGTTVLRGNNTYTGTTRLLHGALFVDGSIASSTVEVVSGTTFGGSGTAGPTGVQIGGTLAPGDNNIGTLQVNGNLAIAPGGRFAGELSPGAADKVIVNVNASIAGNLTATLVAGSYGHQTFTLLHATGAVSGTFASVSITGLAGGLLAGVTYGTQDITLTTDHAPVAATADKSASHGQSFAMSSLISVTDADGDSMTRYQLWDSNRDPTSGYFKVNGVAQTPGTVIDITAAELAQTAFVAGFVGDSLQIRAFDGFAWSAADNVGWAPFTVSVPANNAPNVTTSNLNQSRNQTLSLSSLFSVTDGDGDAMTKYQLWDSGRDANSGYFTVNGVAQAAGTVINVTAAQLAQTAFVTGKIGDNLEIRAFDGVAWSAGDTAAWAPFTVNVANAAPVLTTGNVTKAHLQSYALSSLFSVTDGDGDAMTKYQLWDSTRDPNSGYFKVNGVAQAAGTVIEISAAQLAQTSFVTGVVGDSLQIRAFDGLAWSAGDNAAWSPFAIAVPANNVPVVTTGNVTKAHLQSFALSSLFSVTDADGDAMTRYQLWDSSLDPASGYFTVNGVKQGAGRVIDISAAQLSQTSFVTGTVGDSLQIRAFDGLAWSAGDTAAWSPFAIAVPANNAPVMTTGNVTKAHLQSYALSSLFLVTDGDGDAMIRYQLWDSTRDPSSGSFVVNGVAQAAGTVIDISAAQLAQTSFVTGGVGDSLQIRAFDGITWSASDSAAWSPFAVSVPANQAPVVTTGTFTPQHGRSLALSSLISISDGDGDSMTRYQLWDSSRDPNSGYFMVNGVAQPASTVIDVSAAQLAQTFFVTGKTGDSLQVRAFDGIAWSAGDNAAWSPFAVSVPPYTAPSLTTQDINTTSGQSLSLSSLFSVTDPDGHSMTRYQLWDSSRDASSGHFMVNGVAQSAGTVIDITAAQLAQTSFLTGTIGDALQIRAFDGISWTAPDTAGWAPFHVSV